MQHLNAKVHLRTFSFFPTHNAQIKKQKSLNFANTRTTEIKINSNFDELVQNKNTR